MKRFAGLLLACLLLFAAAAPTRAALLPFVWRSPLPQGNALLGVAYGDAGFVAVGSGGAIVTSPDGATWTLRSAGTHYRLGGVAYGAGRYVAGRYVAVGAGGLVLTSADGAEWQAAESGTKENLNAVIYASQMFVAVGDHGTALTSLDGVNWRKNTIASNASLQDVAFGNGRFVATSAGTAHVLQTEELGLLPVSTFNLAYSKSVAFGNGRFVSVGSGKAMTSPDGADWTVQPLTAKDAEGTGFAGGQFFAFGLTPAVSPDGLQWQEIKGFPGVPRAAAFGAGQYVAVGEHGLIATSADGLKWQAVSRRALQDSWPKAVAYGQGLWVVAGQQVNTSADGGLTWQGANSGSGEALAIGPERMVAVGNGGSIATSADGVTWTHVRSPAQHHLQGVAYGNSQFVAVGLDGEILTSPDGLAWTLQNSGLKPYLGEIKPFLNDITFTGDRFVAVGDEGTILLSADGTTWRQADLPPYLKLTGVAAGGGLVVAVGENGVILVSADGGGTWRFVPRMGDGDLTDVAYGAGRFVAVGGFGQVITSSDSLTWTRDATGSGENVQAVAYGDGQFLLAGDGGNILSLAAADIPAVVCASGFPDVPSDHPACQALTLLGAKGLVGGMPDGTFQPDRSMTRAEFAKVTAGVFGQIPQPWATAPFTDVAGHWAYKDGYIQAVVAMKALSGYPDGRFGPDLPVTRAEAVKILAAAAGLKPAAPGEDDLLASFLPYTDLAPDAWYTGWVKLAYFAGVAGPLARFPVWTGREFQGDRPITRAEAAQLLANMVRR